MTIVAFDGTPAIIKLIDALKTETLAVALKQQIRDLDEQLALTRKSQDHLALVTGTHLTY